MSYQIGWATCPQCGDEFYRDESWKRTCLECWKEKKLAKDSGFASSARQGSDNWRDRYNELKSEYDSLWADYGDVLYQLDELQEATSGVARALQTKLKDLLVLCHPDHHNNSERATRATQWLLEVRKELAQ